VDNELRVEVRSDGGATVLALGGELDLASSPMLEAELKRVGAQNPELLIVDLRELAFMDSTGLSALVRAYHRAREAGGRFGLVNGPPQIQRLLSLTGIGDRIAVVESPEELTGGG
jgi:anti-sigma B factor antagonist